MANTMNFNRLGFSILILALVAGSQEVTESKLNAANVLQNEIDQATVDYRLPKSIVPINYELMLIPEFEFFEFEGILKITAVVKETTNSITLHAGDITILGTSLKSNGRTIKIINIEQDKITETYKIFLTETLPEGAQLLLALSYTGELNDRMVGFYRSSYVGADGKIKWLASTQFQSTHARHAFPCFDEPSFKATFTISIQRNKKYTSLSNMPLKSTREDEDTRWDTFEQSIPMSTYVVAFIVSEFDYLETGNFRVWARSNAIDQAEYGLTIGTQGLSYLSKLFQQDYQLPKMDMVAVPDFAAGAMENWGLVTYRETRMLYDEKESSATAQQSVAAVIIHELTHMWFGNMVTPEWWGYLWLSEAFARYFQYFATAEIETSWKMDDQFIVDQHQTALAVDGLETSPPMTRDVASQSQINAAVDSITYNKGASIVRMMNHAFGSTIFDAGLITYLESRKKDGIARPEHLWSAFEEQIKMNNIDLANSVENIMSTWTRQPGFPVLNVTIRYDIAVVEQERFLLRNLRNTPTDSSWVIPLTWTSKSTSNFGNTTARSWLSRKTAPIYLGTQNREWVIFNVQSAGFYRVNYDNSSWYRIFDVLNNRNHEDIHVLNRAAIVDDLLNLARAGLLEYEKAMDGLQYLKRERNYLPFKSFFYGLEYLNQRFAGTEHYSLFKKFVLMLIEDVYNEVGYEDRATDDRLTVLLRRELNKWACNFDHEGCVSTFTEMFEQWRRDESLTIKPNQRPVAYCTAIRRGNEADWNFLWEKYFNGNSANEQVVILEALGCSTNTAILEKYLLRALRSYEETRIRRQDSTSVFSAVYNSGLIGAEFIIDFVQKHHAEMAKYYRGPGTIASILSAASKRFSTQRLVDRFEQLINTHKSDFEFILNSLQNSLEIAKYELSWYKQNEEPIVSWIVSYVEEPDSVTDAVTDAVTVPTIPTIPTVTPSEPEETSPIDDDDKPGTTPPPVTPPDEDDTKDTTDYFLPKDIIPSKYSIALTPYIEVGNFTFSGTVRITGNVGAKTKRIVMHSNEIEVHDCRVKANGKEVGVDGWTMNEKYNFLTINLREELQPKMEIIVEVEYVGHLNTEMKGFYRSSYLDDEGKRRWLAATHLEPVGARKMFPCFDEPALKAIFEIQVSVPEGYHAISNMPSRKTTPDKNNRKWIAFEPTPKMSTYLVALVVSDFKSLSNKEKTLSVWARPNAIHQTTYAHSVMDPLVKFFENVLGLPYQLPKLDMVALPDFASGAMENWGLLTYREKNMLYDPENSIITAKQSIANVISHEIAHQWFGNLVSPAWWKYLWLNEGFARYYQYFGTSNVEKDWSLESQFVVEQLHSAFTTDSAASIHAMSHDVYNPKEIRAIFDAISYAKGGSVLRMVEKTFGREVFYKALHRYLKSREYDAAVPEDLFDAFKEEIKDVNLKNSIHDIMNSWTTQPGFPVVHVSFKDGKTFFHQERFLLKNKDDADVKKTWHVPISWSSVRKPEFDKTSPRYWLKEADGSIDLKRDSTDLLLFNVQQAGYYRVNYDDEYWQKIAHLFKLGAFDSIHEINRASLIDDLMNLARAGYVDYEILLKHSQYLENESNYIPWRAFFNGLNYLNNQLKGKDVYEAYRRYVSGILTPLARHFSNEDPKRDDHVTKLLRIYVNKWACELDMPYCPASQYLELWDMDHLDKVPVDHRGIAYCKAASTNSYQYWYLLWQAYTESPVITDKLIVLQSMACTTKEEFLNELLLKAITKDSEIRSHDSASVFSSVYNAGPAGVEFLMDFIPDNFNKIVEYYGDTSNIKSFVNALGKKLYTVELRMKYEKLLDWLAGKDSTLQKSLQSYKKSANYEFEWSKKHIPPMHDWFSENYPENVHRLPKLFTPLRYNISLAPYFEERKFTFEGRVLIEMQRVDPFTSRIVLNADQLDIKKISIYKSNSHLTDNMLDARGAQLKMRRFQHHAATQKLEIFVDSIIENEKIIADIEFSGKLHDDMKGFYRSYYVDDKDRVHWLATTQFEPTYARRAFPCFDEPEYKATFIINIESSQEHNVLSNMPIEKSRPSEVQGRVWDSFKETVPMSSYLVAFVVSDFESIRNGYDKVNVWGRSDVARYGDLAQIAAKRMLEYFHTETGIEYALPKLDLIGIPDFEMGAMENWGLSTYREYGLFYKKNVTSARYTDYIVTIIAHELSHMWFGNLVTCQWWEYLWLNEGFAEYMQWRVGDMFRPTHRYNDLFVVHELHPALQFDSVEGRHPMNHAVDTPSEIRGKFDTISYGKGASIIRMLEKSLQPDVFSKAIRNYLSDNEYRTATPKDLWNSIDFVVNETRSLGDWEMSMEELMDSWTNKAGYPVVHATLDNHVLTLTQERFLVSGEVGDKDDFYWVPITIASYSDIDFSTTSTSQWLGKDRQRVYIENPKEWFIVNVQQSGFYRVNYDEQSWTRLIAVLKGLRHTLIHVTNRAQVIDDLLNLARADYLNYNLALEGTKYLLKEEAYPPWKAFFNGMNYISQRYEGQMERKFLGEYIITLTSNLYDKLGFEDLPDESHFDQLNRELILNWVCKYEYEDCVTKSRLLFNHWMTTDENTISPNARPAVYCTAMRHGIMEDWHFLWNQYLKSDIASEQKVILDALGCAKNKLLLTPYVRSALRTNYTHGIRQQDVSAVFASVYNSGEYGVDFMLDFLENNYELFYEYYGNWQSVGAVFTAVASRISTTGQQRKLEQMIQYGTKLERILPTLRAARTTAYTNYYWYRDHSTEINRWLLSVYDEFNGTNGAGSAFDSSFMSIRILLTLVVTTLYLFVR